MTIKQHLAREVIDWIVNAAAEVHQTPSDFMVNKFVHIDDHGVCAARALPIV